MIGIREVLAKHPEVNHMLQDTETRRILHWMCSKLDTADFEEDGIVDATSVGEHAIIHCPGIDPDASGVSGMWEGDDGGVWDAAFIWALWAEMTIVESEAA